MVYRQGEEVFPLKPNPIQIYNEKFSYTTNSLIIFTKKDIFQSI
jgi:hypothetical protein